MSSMQESPKSFQSRKSSLMSKAYELSSVCDAEVFLIVGRESKYLAYSSFNRAESVKTFLRSSNTKIWRPSYLQRSPSTPKDPAFRDGEYAATTLSAIEMSRRGRAPLGSTLMSIDYLCTSPAAQGANTAAVIDHNICAPAASRHGHTTGLPSVQLQRQLSEKSGDREAQKDRPHSPEGQGKGRHPNAERKGQKQASRHNTYGHVPFEGAYNLERKLRGQPLATVKTDLYPQKAVPKFCDFPLAEPNKTTENTGERLPKLQATPQHQAIFASQVEKDAQDVIEARSRSLVKYPRERQNSIEAAKSDSPLSRNKNSRTLDEVISKVEGKSRAELQAMTVPLFDHKDNATLTGGERVKANRLRSELTAPDLAILHKDRTVHTNSVGSKGSMIQGALTLSTTPRESTVTKAAFGRLPSQTEGVNAALDKTELEKPPQQSLGCVTNSAQALTHSAGHDNVFEVLNEVRREYRRDSSAEAAFRIEGLHKEENLSAAHTKANSLGERQGNPEPNKVDCITQDGGVGLAIREEMAQDQNQNKCNDPGKACEYNIGKSEAISQERVTVDAIDDKFDTSASRTSEIDTDLKPFADEGPEQKHLDHIQNVTFTSAVHEPRSYTCAICDRSYKRSDLLKRHMHTHTKPFEHLTQHGQKIHEAATIAEDAGPQSSQFHGSAKKKRSAVQLTDKGGSEPSTRRKRVKTEALDLSIASTSNSQRQLMSGSHSHYQTRSKAKGIAV